ncbi:MAG: flippase-like domain-containing protein [Candidatus Hydrogenedentes bacterium]|nr:flippase-like domain-containing protein [Candidatus Hydrogenedentota bacterium]
MNAIKSKIRKRGLFLFKCLITVAMLVFVYTTVDDDLPKVLETLRSTSIPLLLLAFANHLAGRFLMAYQTRLGLQVYGVNYSTWSMFKINLQTMFYGAFLPGDFSGFAVKWYLISRIDGRRPEILATMVYIRLVYLIVVLVSGLAALVVHWPFESLGLLYSGLAVLSLMLFATFAIHLQFLQSHLDRFAEYVTSWAPLRRLRSPFHRLHEAINAFSRMGWRDIVAMWGTCILVKLSITFSFWLLAKATGIPVSFVTLLWIQSAVEVIQFLPISISGLGVREISVIYMLGSLGVAESTALGFSLLILVLRIGMIGMGGLFAGTDLIFGQPSKHKPV